MSKQRKRKYLQIVVTFLCICMLGGFAAYMLNHGMCRPGIITQHGQIGRQQIAKGNVVPVLCGFGRDNCSTQVTVFGFRFTNLRALRRRRMTEELFRS